MSKKRAKRTKKVKVVFITNDEQLPDGYLPIAGIMFAGEVFQMAIPEKLASEHPELVNQLANDAQKEFLRLVCGVMDL